jgi:hypothetical protein
MEPQIEYVIEKATAKLQEEQALLPAVHDALTQFVSDLSKIEHVHSAFVSVSGKIVELRIFLNNDTYNGEADVFDAEERLIDNFNGLLFDFYVIPKGNRPIENFLSPDWHVSNFRKNMFTL